MDAPQNVLELDPPAVDGMSTTATLHDAPLLNGTHPSLLDESSTSAENDAPANATAFSSNSIVETRDEIIMPSADSGAVIPKVAEMSDVTEYIPTEHKNSHPTPPPEPATMLESDAQQGVKSEADLQSSAPPEATSVANIAPSAPNEAATVTDVQPPALPLDTSMTGVAPAGELLLDGVAQVIEAPITPSTVTDTLNAPSEPSTATNAPEPVSTLVRQRDEDADDDDGPAAKRNKLQEDEVKPLDAPASVEHESAGSTDVAMQDAPQASIEPATPVSGATGVAKYHTTPLTAVQKNFLEAKTRALKKTKHAAFFLLPVDAIKLGIPTYYQIITTPMDLSTLETKLKNDEYASAQAYADDFNQIVANSRRFNGDAHAVTVAALNMEATFKKYMSTLPGPQQTAPVKPLKRTSPAAPRPQPRREARQPPPAPISASPSTAGQTFALQADGTPQIRRDSTTKRPHRTIKPPQSRELPYTKPKRKEHQLELKFCEYVLNQARGPAFHPMNQVFLQPVDPIALNLPTYRQVIRHPMDLATMSQKLKSGQYSTAKEFHADFDLMISNCFAFNPAGNPVRDLGIQMKRAFEQLWASKEKWERANKKSSERASSDSDSEDEEDDDEDDDDPAANARETIAALTKQLAELQKTVAAASWSKDGKKKKDKKRESKKSSFSGAGSKSKSSKLKIPKKAKPPTYEEKQEISNAVGRMDEQQVTKLTAIITDNCEKYRNMDEMELEIDELPNEVQIMLLHHVRQIFGYPKRGARAVSPDDVAADDDDDFAPPARDRAAAGGKRKKHKPMGKKEQQENIAQLRSQLAAFNNPVSGSESPTAWNGQHAPVESSGDEESEESEEE